MASHYDEKKKCRVGIMDEAQFHAETDQPNGAYFKTLLKTWQRSGGTLKWGAGGVGLRSQVGGKEAGICFVAPAYAGKKNRIEVSLTVLAKQVGAARSKKLKAGLQEAASDNLKGTSMVSILDPGTLAASARKKLTTTLCELI